MIRPYGPNKEWQASYLIVPPGQLFKVPKSFRFSQQRLHRINIVGSEANGLEKRMRRADERKR